MVDKVAVIHWEEFTIPYVRDMVSLQMLFVLLSWFHIVPVLTVHFSRHFYEEYFKFFHSASNSRNNCDD